MPDEDPTRFRIAGQQPPIPVGTSERPRIAPCSAPLQVRISPIKWKGRVGDAPRGLFLPAFELLDEGSKARGMGAARG